MTRRANDDLPIFVQWTDFMKWLFSVTEKFPKRVRFTFSERIDNLALDIFEDLVEARYAREKAPILRRANLRLEKMRLLLRMCHELRHLPHAAFEHSARSLNETGRMLGGWIRQRENTTE